MGRPVVVHVTEKKKKFDKKYSIYVTDYRMPLPLVYCHLDYKVLCIYHGNKLSKKYKKV